jgi:asparagine synthase (glutamine-hydrolysing)
MESDVPLGTLLSGGIDSSLVSAAAQASLTDRLRTFNVRFAEKEYDETWAAVAVANHINSHHEILDMESNQGSWNHITALLLHAGQPYADSSLFAANAVCRLMRRHVTVALSGDGGDEGFGGYDLYSRIAKIAHWQRLPLQIRHGGAALLGFLAYLGLVTDRLPHRIRDLSDSDNTSMIQTLWCWIREEEHRNLCRDTDVLPVRRFFEPEWEYRLSPAASRLEHLSAHATEVITRLTLPNDFLFKVDTASMKESLEVRVPMLDEDLFDFGLTLPHHLRINGRTCKRVLREVAKRRLPDAVAAKPKWGFGIPLDTWVDGDFKSRVRDSLLGPSTKLPEFFRPKVYRPIIEAFCDNRPYDGISRQGLYQRAIMLLSLHLMLAADS